LRISRGSNWPAIPKANRASKEAKHLQRGQPRQARAQARQAGGDGFRAGRRKARSAMASTISFSSASNASRRTFGWKVANTIDDFANRETPHGRAQEDETILLFGWGPTADQYRKSLDELKSTGPNLGADLHQESDTQLGEGTSKTSPRRRGSTPSIPVQVPCPPESLSRPGDRSRFHSTAHRLWTMTLW
jgi:hypothetical protein